MKNSATIATSLLLASCTAVWGEAYKVEFASPASITINFDPAIANMGEIQHVAEAHCAKYDKHAVPQASQNTMWKLRTTSYVCVKEQ